MWGSLRRPALHRSSRQVASSDVAWPESPLEFSSFPVTSYRRAATTVWSPAQRWALPLASASWWHASSLVSTSSSPRLSRYRRASARSCSPSFPGSTSTPLLAGPTASREPIFRMKSATSLAYRVPSSIAATAPWSSSFRETFSLRPDPTLCRSTLKNGWWAWPRCCGATRQAASWCEDIPTQPAMKPRT